MVMRVICLVDQDVASWNALILGYSQCRSSKEHGIFLNKGKMIVSMDMIRRHSCAMRKCELKVCHWMTLHWLVS